MTGRLLAVAGLPGTGTTTLCRLLAARTGLPHVYAGRLFRELAAARGLSLAEFGAQAEKDPGIDRDLDRRMVEAAKTGAAILEGRLVAWQVREAGTPALRVLLVAPERVRAERVAQREGLADVERVLAENRAREASEAKRYLAYYAFDPNDPAHYDLVIDSSRLAPDEIASAVLAAGGR